MVSAEQLLRAPAGLAPSVSGIVVCISLLGKQRKV